MLPDGDQTEVERSGKVAQAKVQKLMVIKECCVSYCKNVADEYCNIHLFPLPERPDSRWHKWLYACNRVDVIKEAAFLIKTRVKYFVCNKHFEDRMFEDQEKKVLVADAEPTIFRVFRNTITTFEVVTRVEEAEMSKAYEANTSDQSERRQESDNCIALLEAITQKFKRDDVTAEQVSQAFRACSDISVSEIRSLISPELSSDSGDAIPSEDIYGSIDSFSGLIYNSRKSSDTDDFPTEGLISPGIKSETDSIDEFESRSEDVKCRSDSIVVKSCNNVCHRFVPTSRTIKNNVHLSGCLTYIFKKRDKNEDGSYPVIPFLSCENEEITCDHKMNIDEDEKVPEISYNVDNFDYEPRNKISRTFRNWN